MRTYKVTLVSTMALLILGVLAGGYIPAAHATAGLDGHATTQSNCSSSCTVPLTTTNANDVIYLAFASVTAPTITPPTVADTAGLTWHLRGSNTYLFTWYAIAASPLSSDIITVTANDGNPTAELFAFGISGANTASPFDSGAGIPAAGQSATNPHTLAITTSNANDMIVGAVMGASTSYAASAGFTQIDSSTAPAAAAEYEIVGSAGSQTISFDGSAAASYLIADAVQLLGASTTSVICVPSSVAVGSPSTCTATVTGSSPTGTITWSQSGSGSVTFSSSTCALSSGACSVTATGLSAGSVTVQGAYGGDSGNAASSATFSLAVTTPTLTITPSQGPTGVTTTLSGGSYSHSYTYNYCYKASTGSPSVCSSALQFTTDSSGNIPGGKSVTTSGASNGLVVVSDPAGAGTVIASATFTITTPAISFVPTSSAVGSSVLVTGSGFSVSTSIGTFTFAGSTPGTQTCTSQTTSATGAFACTFTVPSDVAGPYTVIASGGDVGSVSADTASATFTIPALPATTTSVVCVPSSIAVGSPSTCTATVTGASPTGTVTWSQSGSGLVTFSSSTCALSAGSCSVTATGLSAGPVTVHGTYGGDSGNAASSGTFSLTVTTPTLTITPSRGPTGVTTTLSGASYSQSYTYNYCYKTNTGSATVCPNTLQFTTDASGNIPGGKSVTTSGASNGLVVVSDPAGAGTVIASATFTITTPAISLVPTSSAVGSSVIVTGSGFSVTTAIGAFTFGGSTPGTQTCTSQTTSSAGAFACTFTVPADVAGPYTVTTSGSDIGSVSADTASASFTIPALPATTTSVVCVPSSIAVGSPSTCTATVTGASPTGTITWSQTSLNGGSVTFSSGTCALSSGACSVTATGVSAGSVLVLGAYGGDGSNAPSSGTFSLAVSTPTLTITPSQGPTGVTTTLSGGSYSHSYTYNYCYKANTGSPSVCSSALQFTTDSSGNIPGGKSVATSGATNGLVVVSDPISSNVIASSTFTITTPAISLNPSQGLVGNSVSVTGTGFSVSTSIGTFTYAGSTPGTQTCTSQTTSGTGAFSCTFTVPASSAGAHTVIASGSDLGSVPADTASAAFTITTPAISLVLTHGAAGSSVIVTGSGFSVSASIGTFTYAGSTPATQTCTSQTTSSAGAFACTFTVPGSAVGPHTVIASGSDIGSVPTDTASATYTIDPLPATTTSVVCVPSSVAVGSPSTCTATVTGASPTGTITWSQGSTNGGSVTFSSPTCPLSSGTCSVTATGVAAGTVIVDGVYGGDGSNAASSGTFSLSVTTPTLTITPSRGPTGVTTILSGGSYTHSYIYNYCYEASTGSASLCSSALQFTTDASGNIPGGKSVSTSGASNGLVVVSDPTSSNVVTSATFTVTTPAISLVSTSGAAGAIVTVTGSGFSVTTAIGTFTFGGSTPATQSCISQTTSGTGAFSCTFVVPSSSAGAHTVTTSGSDFGSVPADTASATFTLAASVPEFPVALALPIVFLIAAAIYLFARSRIFPPGDGVGRVG